MPKSNLQKAMVFLLLSFITLNGYGQQLMNSLSIDLKSNKDVFQITDGKINKTTFFLSDRKKVIAYLLDENLGIEDTISITRPEKKFKDILGFSGQINKPTIYWTSDNKEEIYIQTLDFQSRKSTGSSTLTKLQENNERYLESFCEKGNFYFLTVKAKSSLLNIYEYSGDQLIKHEIDLSSHELYKTNDEKASLSRILAGHIDGVDDFESSSLGISDFDNSVKSLLCKINSESPLSLSETARKRKMYTSDNEIILTLDFCETMTQVIIIDLNTHQSALKNIEKPVLKNPEKERLKTNSFIIDHKIIQIAVLPNEINLSLKELDGTLIKMHIISENEEFKIKNKPFVRQNHMGSERSLETTSQFLRKIYRSNIGVSAYKLYENYYVTLGSISIERPTGGGFGMGMPGVPMAGNFALHPINPIGINYFGYSNRRSISTDCLFDKNLNHVKGQIEPLAFDKIEELKKKYSSNFILETVFKIGNNFYFGYYEYMIKQYGFRKFND